ncbi:MAG: four helix bundle protein [Prevotella sp.]|nr:four helix bundle protein [Prevotella sp.]
MLATGLQDFLTWQRAHEYVLQTYKDATVFPNGENNELGKEIRKAAIDIATNITIAYNRPNKEEKKKFVAAAQSNIDKSTYLLTLAKDLGYIMESDENALETALENCIKMFSTYRRSLYEQRQSSYYDNQQ